jgi:hypothetical protein
VDMYAEEDGVEEGTLALPLTLATTDGPLEVPIHLQTALDSVYGVDRAEDEGEVHHPVYLFLRCSDANPRLRLTMTTRG